MGKRYIKLYEQITEWEWFHQPNTLCLFIYLLLKAYYKDTMVGGKLIKRGQIVTSLPKLSTGTGLTIRQTRTALSHLISTGEVTDESSNQNRVITIVKYDCYQNATDELTGKRQANDRRVDRQTTDESTPYIESIERVERNKKDKRTPSVFTPPSVEEVEDYCRGRGNGIGGQEFVDFYASKGWMIGKNRMKDWKAAVRTWENERKKRGGSPSPAPAPAKKPDARDVHGYAQRDYSSEQAAAIARMMQDGWGDD